eukprot:scpid92244/ scgid11206/ 
MSLSDNVLFVPTVLVYMACIVVAVPIPTASPCNEFVDVSDKLYRHGSARVLIPRNGGEQAQADDVADIRKIPCHEMERSNGSANWTHLDFAWVTVEDERCQEVFEEQCMYSHNVYPPYSARAGVKPNVDLHRCGSIHMTCQPVKTWTLVLQRVCKERRLLFVLKPFEYVTSFSCQPVDDWDVLDGPPLI